MTESAPTTQADDFAALLAELKIPAKKAEAIMERYRVDTGALTYVWSVGVDGARVGVETIAIHGLEITLDANGNAESVSSPHGLIVDPAY
jgi:hypothetical protein